MEEKILNKIFIEQIHRIVKNLDHTEYAVFNLRYIHGYSQQDTANELCKMRSQISRIERKLINHIRKEMRLYNVYRM